MKQTTCERAWYEAYLDTPFTISKARVARAHAKRDPDDLLDVPGVNLKSREQDSAGWPKAYGKLVSHEPEKVVVRSKPDAVCDNLKCVWVGTPGEYTRMWTVD